MTLDQVDTPALLVELDSLERNIARMADETARHGIQIRPHAKAHKCAVIALQQISVGAVGVCCQKLSEAEALVEHGVGNVLITNEIVDYQKLERLARLARQATVAVCVDHPNNVDALAATAERLDAHIDVMIEVEVGTGRCGIRSGDAALLLAERIAAASHLRFRGLQAYHGRAQHVRRHVERKAAIEQSTRATRNTVDLLARNGFACRVVSGGGTGSYEFELASGVYSELQPGSYIFMDADYRQNIDANGQAVSQFCQSLFVYTQVMSVPGADYAVVDAGLKALAFDSGMPRVADMPDVIYERPSDEHGILDIRSLSGGLRLGAKLRLIPGHCDPTVSLHDWFVAIRGNRVEALWPIVARGALS